MSKLSDYIGKSYNYADGIETPKQKGVTSATWIWDLGGDIDSLGDYIQMLNNKVMGNNYFIKSGWCNNDSSNECKGKDRWLFVRNIPTGHIPCTNLKTNLKGLVPGLFEDAADISLSAVINNAMGKGSAVSDKCVSRTEYVGTNGNLKPQTKCSSPYIYPSCTIESFKNNIDNTTIYFYILWLLLIIITLYICYK